MTIFVTSLSSDKPKFLFSISKVESYLLLGVLKYRRIFLFVRFVVSRILRFLSYVFTWPYYGTIIITIETKVGPVRWNGSYFVSTGLLRLDLNQHLFEKKKKNWKRTSLYGFEKNFLQGNRRCRIFEGSCYNFLDVWQVNKFAVLRGQNGQFYPFFLLFTEIKTFLVEKLERKFQFMKINLI